MKSKYRLIVVLMFLVVIINSCNSKKRGHYTLHYFKRTRVSDSAVISSSFFEANKIHEPLMSAAFQVIYQVQAGKIVQSKLIRTRANYYNSNIEVGKLKVRGVAIGYWSRYVKHLQTHAGDSILLNFYLQPDTRPLY
ncbi:hypothetical protein HH214_17725 [Mucilaginibacter robiniae]|uniref:Uncharacterized protein n=1 Tax=Mucilaginibacter robiniae TaxID=2728022 RepID=A0A7L5E2S5_9SPHI|nr:hypothetical protein [Mucilaginibacter robiniae]QJD97582.1 hypothetical protein HH214_17725 [Mucilaginibacter robiniae]